MNGWSRWPACTHWVTGLALLMTAQGAAAQTSAVVTGRVVQEGGAPLGGAEVTMGSRGAVFTDNTGAFRITDVEAGNHALRVSAIGFASAERRITVPQRSALTITLRPTALLLDAVTVTGTMKRTSVKDSPVKVEVVPVSVLQRTATSNLTEAIQYVNGLYNQIDCGVCYTNNIRINGMHGPYTAVLIDGMPLMSALASIYGLNGIDPALIQQIEIIKGPSSTLYGSEAMAGVVNVITKDPRFAPRFSMDASLTSDAEGDLDVSAASQAGNLSGFVSGNASYNNRFVDGNGDGFTDFPLVRRAIVMGKLEAARQGVRRAQLTTRYQYEDRFGGVKAWTPEDRGSATVYGESIYTKHFEAIGSWLPVATQSVRVEGSYTWHDQDSYYGDSRYAASQQILVGNLLFDKRKERHDLLAGATARYQLYDDNTPATAQADRRVIPGLLAQDEYRWTKTLTTLGGVRADHHQKHGLILSPRLALKWDPWPHTAFRLNAGTGFRVVNLFAEDHAALTGAREVVLAAQLQPERSKSVTVNLNQIIEVGPSPMMIDVDLFYTRFSNKIVPDYDRDPNLIVYDNLNGYAVSRGVSLALNQNVDFDRFLYSLGVTVQDVFTVNNGTRDDEFFAPHLRGVASATYNFRTLPLRLEYTGSVTGPMRLPQYHAPFDRPDHSPTYSLHNVQGSWRVRSGTELYVSAKNVFGYVQPSALIDPAHPFSDTFDTAYIYGPMRGRHIMLGMRYGVSQ